MVSPVEELEVELVSLSAALTSPGQGECLFCHVYRMLNSHGCNGKLRWAACWRDLRAPRATGLERRLGARGGYCDCEIFMNGWTASSAITIYNSDHDEEVWPDPMPACRRVGPRSTQPCSLWAQLPGRGGTW